MRRDDDLLRRVLFKFEENDDWVFVLREYLNMPLDERRFQYHVMLAADAGLVAPVGKSTYRLTNVGHDYLDAIRDDGIWERTKRQVAETGGNATLDILKQLAIGALKKKISDHTGVDL
jgi:hypothetical protein